MTVLQYPSSLSIGSLQRVPSVGTSFSSHFFCINDELAGIGGGGIVSAVWVITSEVVDVRQRATWSQALSVTWSCSAIAGPLIGGIFSGTSFLTPLKRSI